MTLRPEALDDADAVELGELLGFLVGWLDSDDDLAGSFAVFVGHGGYDLGMLRDDAARFAFVLAGHDGGRPPGGRW